MAVPAVAGTTSRTRTTVGNAEQKEFFHEVEDPMAIFAVGARRSVTPRTSRPRQTSSSPTLHQKEHLFVYL
jgi:hypothetical protein